MDQNILNILHRLSPSDLDALKRALDAANPALRGVSPEATSTKTADTVSTTPGDIVTFTLQLTNTATGNLSNITVYDYLYSNEFALVPGSVTVDGVSAPDDVLTQGQVLGAIAPGTTKTVMFQAEIKNIRNGSFYNSAYFYYQLPDGSSQSSSAQAYLWNETDERLTKAADTFVAQPGDVVTYTLTYTNTNSFPIEDGVLTDYLLASQNANAVVPGSLTVNGVQYPDDALFAGLNLPTIPPGDSIVVEYQVLMEDPDVNGNILLNQAQIEYSYQDPATGNTYYNSVISPIVATFISRDGFIGPPGPQGPQGPQGPAGPQGPSGNCCNVCGGCCPVRRCCN
ncbi:MAG: DUF11 domain-containing protein [Christensenellaceae bacterium]|nr:DUF11 domain-containing protein [Christensenellaceae bacterium]